MTLNPGEKCFAMYDAATGAVTGTVILDPRNAQPPSPSIELPDGSDIGDLRNWIVENGVLTAAAFMPDAQDVDEERDRRIEDTFVFNGVAYDNDPVSKQRIAGAGSKAGLRVLGGAQPGDLTWYGAPAPFTWIAKDNTLVTMDAQTCEAFASAAMLHESAVIFAALALKGMDPIPSDFKDDIYWP